MARLEDSQSVASVLRHIPARIMGNRERDVLSRLDYMVHCEDNSHHLYKLVAYADESGHRDDFTYDATTKQIVG